MGRRSTLVAFAAVALAALLPMSAQAAVPATNLDVVVSASTVTLNWTPSADALDPTTAQAVVRDAAACAATPSGAAVTIPVDVAANFYVDSAVANGTYCYYVETTSAIAPPAYVGAAATVNVDTTRADREHPRRDAGQPRPRCRDDHGLEQRPDRDESAVPRHRLVRRRLDADREPMEPRPRCSTAPT